jgi:signal transduction histidine kinase
MMRSPMRSLRSRLLLAALLWSGGMLAFAHLAFLLVAHYFPSILRMHPHWLIFVSVAFLVAGFILMHRSLARLDALREGLATVKEGKADRVAGEFPSEVAPLVADLNALLAHRQEVVRRALAKAGDLAHGLKTPLAVLSHEAALAQSSGNGELAAAILREVERMRRQIDYHLAHARAAGAGAAPGVRSFPRESVEALRRTMLRLHADRGIAIDVDIPEDHAVRAQREDLDEMLGNLLDNGCKWARSRIAVHSEEKGDNVVIIVDDDGPGLDPSMRERVLQRGVRADEAAPGSGLGLAIVRDLAELHHGSLRLDPSPLGGLCARLVLKKA